MKKIAVIGAGTMGQGIVHITALAGFSTSWYDVNEEILKKGIDKVDKNLQKGIELGKLSEVEKQGAIQKIEITTNIHQLKADLIIEAVVEDLQVKITIFKILEQINEASTILASNTSSLSITAISSHLKYPDRFIGLHFFNPAHIMKLVEIVSCSSTSLATIKQVQKFSKILQKTSVLAKDSPGFIVNRVARHYYTESLKLLEEQVADVKTIDTLLEATGFKMGPFKLMDLIGIDVNYAVTQSIYNAFHQDPKFRPSLIQEQKVVAGHHGKKTKKGFYDY